MPKERPINLKPWQARAASIGCFVLPVNVNRVPHRVNAVYADPEALNGWLAADISPACCDLPAECNDETQIRCPLGAPGDVLWGRETWRRYFPKTETPAIHYKSDGFIWSPDDYNRIVDLPDTKAEIDADFNLKPYPWRPSTQMPRWASRRAWAVDSVRVCRVRDVSEAEAKSARARLCTWHTPDLKDEMKDIDVSGLPGTPIDRAAYLNGLANQFNLDHPATPWASNPWVWVAHVTEQTAALLAAWRATR